MAGAGNLRVGADPGARAGRTGMLTRRVGRGGAGVGRCLCGGAGTTFACPSVARTAEVADGGDRERGRGMRLGVGPDPGLMYRLSDGVDAGGDMLRLLALTVLVRTGRGAEEAVERGDRESDTGGRRADPARCFGECLAIDRASAA